MRQLTIINLARPATAPKRRKSNGLADLEVRAPSGVLAVTVEGLQEVCSRLDGVRQSDAQCSDRNRRRDPRDRFRQLPTAYLLDQHHLRADHQPLILCNSDAVVDLEGADNGFRAPTNRTAR